jgi:hypothetical protein
VRILDEVKKMNRKDRRLKTQKRNMVKRGDRIRYLQSIRSKTRRKTARALLTV